MIHVKQIMVSPRSEGRKSNYFLILTISSLQSHVIKSKTQNLEIHIQYQAVVSDVKHLQQVKKLDWVKIGVRFLEHNLEHTQ